ncbi:MAG TPA: patatin-like phospholipase family protein [Candidatus Dormibacteraeota bacterium]|nr:patatin-like phospholipase family protein [Candidatus Dormibacteraeota bacterium]
MTSKALVLGGGGITGIAWEIGMIAGLFEAGIDLTAADVVVGTSAGSAVGAQILSGATVEELYEEQLADASSEIATKMGLGVIVRFILAGLWPRDETRARARLGRTALRASAVPESERRHVIESRLRLRTWPEQRLLIVAVDAESGEPRIFDAASGVPIVDAVAASCAVPLVWPPMTVDGHRYMDGGVRSIANADLAVGCERVVVLAPVTAAVRRTGRISTQLAGLGDGVRSVTVSPDSAARRAIGRRVLDPARRAGAARAGREQAADVAESIRPVWL